MNGNFLYLAFGLRIESEIELPGLPFGLGVPDVLFRRGRVDPTDEKANDDVHVMFNAIAGTFRMSRGREIVVDPLPEAEAHDVRLVLLGKAMAALLRQRGWLPLHASGVSIEGRAVLFLGPSGAGKSTAAAALHAKGYSVVTDDVGAVRMVNGECVVCSGLSRLRLSELSLHVLEGNYFDRVRETDKYALGLRQENLPVTLPVARVYILDFDETVGAKVLRVDAVSPLLAAASFSVHSFFQRGKFDLAAVRLHVEACAALAESVPVQQVARARSFQSMPELVRIVEEEMATR